MKVWGGGTRPVQSAGKVLFCRAPPLTFWLYKYAISRFGERFRDGQYTVWSVSYLLLFYSWCPRAQPLLKVGARAPVLFGVDAGVITVLALGITDPKG